MGSLSLISEKIESQSQLTSLASWGTDLLVAYGPADVPRLHDVSLDRYVLLFTLSVSMLTGILFGLAPALHASKPDPGNMLKESAKRADVLRLVVRQGMTMTLIGLVLGLVGAFFMSRVLGRVTLRSIRYRPAHIHWGIDRAVDCGAAGVPHSRASRHASRSNSCVARRMKNYVNHEKSS